MIDTHADLWLCVAAVLQYCALVGMLQQADQPAHQLHDSFPHRRHCCCDVPPCRQLLAVAAILTPVVVQFGGLCAVRQLQAPAGKPFVRTLHALSIHHQHWLLSPSAHFQNKHVVKIDSRQTIQNLNG